MSKDKITTDAEFLQAVRRMRAAQKRFYAAAPRSPARQGALIDARRLESLVDAYLANPPASPTGQSEPDLFSEEI